MGTYISRIPSLHTPPEIKDVYKEAVKFEKGNGVEVDLPKAAQLYKRAADAGYDKAQVCYGNMCLKGEGVAQSNREAFKYFKKAAKNYNWEGKLSTGICYFEGIGTFRNALYAIFHIKACAKILHPKGQFYYGKCLHDGYGCSSDIAFAIANLGCSYLAGYTPSKQLFDQYLTETTIDALRKKYDFLVVRKKFLGPALELAMADLGDVASMYSVAIKALKGEGMRLNYDLSFEYANKAAEQGHFPSHHLLGYLYINGYGCDKDPSKALLHYKTASDGGYVNSHFNVGLLYMNSSNYEEAHRYFQLAIDNDSAEGFYFMAKLYREGKGVESDESKYEEYLEESSKRGYFRALHEHGMYCYEKGKYDKAFKSLINAARYGDSLTYKYIGRIYEKGYGVEKNEKEAFEWYRLGAMQCEDLDCVMSAAKCLQKGIGTESNDEEAKRYYRKAADKGNEKAQRKLREMESEGNE
ncbi:cobalamin biosynthesis protein CobT [Histomonas meleagridis]|uniref:cobalamin biosynthesis protein CobT n=1 Tax=Histomonas meleagridis TaxID=135588 RepID=UPI00355A9775|nr:cobalamin biosynthesis protein CobT [Histomonas meleagridis]KAH0797339.1 cobalamin biosynthesis protein CobT [Histomonas meleagridis]